jgi:hypothetical protein
MKWKRSNEQMATVRKNLIVSGVSGSLGPDHYARITQDGRTIISHKPDFSNRQFSEAQLNVQNRTKQAAAYAKAASKENPIYALKAKGTAMNAYNVAVRDWRRPPVIEDMNLSHDGKVRVSAHDDTMVTRVTISVLDESGQVLEQGEAELVMGVWWDYQTTNEGQVRVEAWDLAGNVTRQEFHPAPRSFSCWQKPVRAGN